MAVGSKDSSSPSKGESKQSTKGQNCPPERLGTAFPGDTGRLSPSWRLLWVFPKPRMAGVYMDWASSAPFLHLSLVPTFPDLPDAHGPKRSLCLSLAQLISCHGQLWSTLPPARLLIPTCFLSSAREAVLLPEDTSSPQRLSQDVGLGHPRDFAPAVSCTLQRPTKVPLQPPLGGFLHQILF